MPCILKIHIEAARGLPIINRTSELVDAYVEIRFADLEPQKTAVCRKTLNPVWKEDFRLEVSDETLLQDEPLEFRIYDFDAVSADDAVGTVALDLNPLLSPDALNQMAGWFPVYDTIRGNRGELWVQAKLEFFENSNPFKDSSTGLHLFSNPGIPQPYRRATIVGLVDVVITEVDPDYHWTDSFRTSRSSNEASQRVLNQMSCRLRRQMGRKALEMGGNSILAYTQCLDIETYTQTITMRGLGTVAILESLLEESEKSSSSSSDDESDRSSKIVTKAMTSEVCLDICSKSIELVTLSRVPPGSVSSIRGVVSAKSVKLISEESDYGSSLVRDQWLTELREEVRSHARGLGCNIVLGYKESITIHDDLYVLCAEGTACRLRRQYNKKKSIVLNEELETLSIGSADEEEPVTTELLATTGRRRRAMRCCAACHIPRKRHQRIVMGEGEETYRCNICKRGFVSEMILSTIDLPTDLETFGETILLEGYVCRPLKKKKESDTAAMTVSYNLPFVEYDLYRQLQFKMRYHGLNAIFGIKYHLVANNRYIIAVASGTGACVTALPEAKSLQISRNIEIKDAEDRRIYEFQGQVAETSQAKHDRLHGLYSDRFPSYSDTSSSSSSSGLESSSSSGSSFSGDSSDDSSSEDDEDTSIVQIDDEADEDLLLTLVQPHKVSASLVGTCDDGPPVDINSEKVHIADVQTATHFICLLRRFAILPGDHHPNFALSKQFQEQYDEMMVQIEGLVDSDPQIRCVRHQLNLVRGVELQIVTTATLFGLINPPRQDCFDSDEQTYMRDEGYYGFSDLSDEEATTEPRSPTSKLHLRNANIIEMQPSIPSAVEFSTCAGIPQSVFNHNCGTLTLQIFKEVYYHESSGGFTGFISATIQDLFAITRANAASLGGNALICTAFKPAAFYENFKSQLHAVLMITGDVIHVDFDHGFPHKRYVI